MKLRKCISAGTLIAMVGLPAADVMADAVYVCEPCKKGEYSDGRTACQKCPAGTASNVYLASNSSVCKSCATGYWSNAGAETCTACTNGPANSEYTSNATSNSCSWKCKDGYLQVGNACQMVQCGPGKYRSGTSCYDCPAGTYKSGTNSNTSCTTCPSGQISKGGESSCHSYSSLRPTGCYYATTSSTVGAGYYIVYVAGAGGGGGGGRKSRAGWNNYSGGDGGWGERKSGNFMVPLGQSYSYSASPGSGGAGGTGRSGTNAEGGDGKDGGSSSFAISGVISISANGGKGGDGATKHGKGSDGAHASGFVYGQAATQGSKGGDGGKPSKSGSAGTNGYIQLCPLY